MVVVRLEVDVKVKTKVLLLLLLRQGPTPRVILSQTIRIKIVQHVNNIYVASETPTAK